MENKISVFNCSVIDLGKISFDEGNLTIVEKRKDFPFDVKRVFYIYDIAGGESRGAHAVAPLVGARSPTGFAVRRALCRVL